MSATSTIEWTDATWNPTVGCTKVSPGCDHCYAETFVNRFAGKNVGFPNRFDVMTVHGDKRLRLPLSWRKPRRIFVNSLSDLFHDDVPAEHIARVFAVMALASHHTFQLLTKRHARMRSLLNDVEFRKDVGAHTMRTKAAAFALPSPTLEWPLPNLWLGVSAESQQWADIRVPALRETPAAVRWVSAEPLLGPLDLVEHHRLWPSLDWVVVGGESGPGARPMHPDWARAIRENCRRHRTPFLFKQWGSWSPTGEVSWGRGPGLHGVEWHVPSTIRDDVITSQGLEVLRRHQHKSARVLDGLTHDAYPEPTR